MPSTSSLESQFQRGVLVSELKRHDGQGEKPGPQEVPRPGYLGREGRSLNGPRRAEESAQGRGEGLQGGPLQPLLTPPSSHTQLAIPGCPHLPEVDLPGLSSKSLCSVPRLEHRLLSLLTTSSTYPSTACFFNPPHSFLMTPYPHQVSSGLLFAPGGLSVFLPSTLARFLVPKHWVLSRLWSEMVSSLSPHLQYLGFPSSSGGKESACNTEDPGSIPGSERSPGGGNGNPLQH